MYEHMKELQEAIPNWVRLERHHGEPVITEKDMGDIHVIDVKMWDEAPEDKEGRIDLHFAMAAPLELPTREELIRLVTAALDEGVHINLTMEELVGGSSYITLGGWLGSQELALMLIALS